MDYATSVQVQLFHPNYTYQKQLSIRQSARFLEHYPINADEATQDAYILKYWHLTSYTI